MNSLDNYLENSDEIDKDINQYLEGIGVTRVQPRDKENEYF